MTKHHFKEYSALRPLLYSSYTRILWPEKKVQCNKLSFKKNYN